MHHLPRIFSHRRQSKCMDGVNQTPSSSPKRQSETMDGVYQNPLPSPKPKLVRIYAAKNFEYSISSSFPSSTASTQSAPRTSSLDRNLSSERSIRIRGNDDQLDQAWRILGLSGPEDFEIPQAAWEEASKLSSGFAQQPKRGLFDDDESEQYQKEEVQASIAKVSDGCPSTVQGHLVMESDEMDGDVDKAILPVNSFSSSVGREINGDRLPFLTPPPVVFQHRIASIVTNIDEMDGEVDQAVPSAGPFNSTVGRGIDQPPRLSPPAMSLRGIDSRCSTWEVDQAVPSAGPFNSTVGRGIDQPSRLTPPPAMSLCGIDSRCSTWDLVKGLAPEADECTDLYPVNVRGFSSYDEADEDSDNHDDQFGISLANSIGRSDSCSFASSHEDDSSSTTTDSSPGGRMLQVSITNWQKGCRLGQGSFGTVYEAISSDGMFFAIKEVSLLEQGSQGRQSILSLQLEIEMLRQLKHENIVHYLGSAADDKNLYIFLEYATKGSLTSLYQTYKLTDATVASYTRQILLGLKYLHSINIVHRDIKCSNILVDSSGTVKLADFGLAKEVAKFSDLKSCKGTALWMAPEVVNQTNQGYGTAVDIWSLGCTVLEMSTRRLPYHPMETFQALYRIGKGEPPTIPNSLSTDLRSFISKCLQVNPKDRPSAGELLDHKFLKRPCNTFLGSESPGFRHEV